MILSLGIPFYSFCFVILKSYFSLLMVGWVLIISAGLRIDEYPAERGVEKLNWWDTHLYVSEIFLQFEGYTAPKMPSSDKRGDYLTNPFLSNSYFVYKKNLPRIKNLS